MSNQLVCSGCRTVLLYPREATNVCCAMCNMVTAVPPAGMEMAQLICGSCRTLLMHARGATSVRCSCCHTVNPVPDAAAPARAPSNVAHFNCGNCRTVLMYPAGAPCVKCAICQYITNVNGGDISILVCTIGNLTPASTTSTVIATIRIQNPTVVVTCADSHDSESW